MKISIALLFLILVSSCAGIKVQSVPHESQRPAEYKPGVTLNGPAIGPIQVQNVGFWCDAKHGMLTFGAFGPTEPEARANAQSKCHGMFKDSPCEISACKPS